MIFSSITNCDPGNVFETFEKLKKQKIRCSVVSLSAALQVLIKLTQATKGDFFLAKDKDHFKDILKVIPYIKLSENPYV